MDPERRKFLLGYRWYLIGSMLSVGATMVVVVLIILWQIGFSTHPSSGIVTTGWMKLLPLHQTVIYSAGTDMFAVSFMNTVGTPIEVSDVNVTEKISGQHCSNVLVNGVDFSLPNHANVTVSPDDMLSVSANCTKAAKNKYDMYDMEITVTYDAVTGEFSTTHVVMGHVRGPAEA